MFDRNNLWSLLVLDFFITLNISCYSLQDCRVSAEKSAKKTSQLYGSPLLWNMLLFRGGFYILCLSLTFAILIMICLGVGLYGFIVGGTFSASCTWICFLFQVGDIFSHTFLQVHFWSPSLSSLSWTPIMWILVSLVLSQRSYTVLIFKNVFSFSDWVLSIMQSSRSLMHSLIKVW